MTALVTWIWQGLAIVIAAKLIVRLCPRLNATTRHVIWWVALGMVLVHPWTPFEAAAAPDMRQIAASTTSTDAASALMLPPLPHPPLWFAVTAIGVWIGMVVWRASLIAASLHTIARLKRESTPVDPAFEGRLPLWRELRASGRTCTLRIGEQAAGPCALGFWRPTILVPRRLVEELSEAELDQVIAHEHAHVLRYDDWLHLAQCCISAVFGLHPALWMIGPQLDLEREAACDDRVVAHTGTPRAYADCLAHVATLLVAHRREATAIAPAVAGSSPLLRTRVERLLNRRWNRTLRVGRLPATVSVLFLGLVVVACDQAPPLVVFGDQTLELPETAIVAVSASVPATPLTSRMVLELPAPILTRGRTRARPSDTPIALPSPSTAVGYVATDVPPSAPVTAEGTSPLATLDAPVAASPIPDSEPHTDAAIDDAARAVLTTDAHAVPQAVDETGASWSNVGSTFARAGVSVGKGAQHAGQSVGRWFSRPPWSGKKGSSQ